MPDCKACGKWFPTVEQCELCPTCERALERLRNYAAPVVHGRWIEDHDYLKCPECGVMVKRDFTFFNIGNWNYCPNCGAKMDEEDKKQ